MRNIKSFEFNNGLFGAEKQAHVSCALYVNSEKRMCPLGE